VFEETFDRFFGKIRSCRAERSVGPFWLLHNDRLFETLSQNCEKRLLGFSSLSARPSIRPHETSRLRPDEFLLNLVFEYFKKNLSRKFKLC
jgi:hypothetical protein